ncbi:MAG: hypothetical protein RR758_11850 [Burkholderiaceae bacterium]
MKVEIDVLSDKMNSPHGLTDSRLLERKMADPARPVATGPRYSGRCAAW